jgi:hypothetical protein
MSLQHEDQKYPTGFLTTQQVVVPDYFTRAAPSFLLPPFFSFPSFPALKGTRRARATRIP